MGRLLFEIDHFSFQLHLKSGVFFIFEDKQVELSFINLQGSKKFLEQSNFTDREFSGEFRIILSFFPLFILVAISNSFSENKDENHTRGSFSTIYVQTKLTVYRVFNIHISCNL